MFVFLNFELKVRGGIRLLKIKMEQEDWEDLAVVVAVGCY